MQNAGDFNRVSADAVNNQERQAGDDQFTRPYLATRATAMGELGKELTPL